MVNMKVVISIVDSVCVLRSDVWPCVVSRRAVASISILCIMVALSVALEPNNYQLYTHEQINLTHSSCNLFITHYCVCKFKYMFSFVKVAKLFQTVPQEDRTGRKITVKLL